MAHRSVIAIRHVAFEDLGSFEQTLVSDGFSLTYLQAGVDDLEVAQRLEPDLLVVLGGPIGANDESDYPFLRQEIALLKTRYENDRPTLGLCLGGQLMARAMGAEVRPGPRKEIGWAPLTLTDAGRASCLHTLDVAPVLHWHGDIFAIPTGATCLAATPDCPNQAFANGTTQLALQFHPEVTVEGLERWYIGHASELSTEGVTLSRLRDDSRRFGPRLETLGGRLLRDWLAQATTRPSPTTPAAP